MQIREHLTRNLQALRCSREYLGLEDGQQTSFYFHHRSTPFQGARLELKQVTAMQPAGRMHPE